MSKSDLDNAYCVEQGQLRCERVWVTDDDTEEVANKLC